MFYLLDDQHVNATIASVTALDGAPLNNYGISPDKSNMNININNPTIGTTYTYTITIHLTLINGVTQVDYMPGVNVNTHQSRASGSVTGTSVSDTNDAGTWTWSSTDSITWNWNEGLSQGINFQGYSIQPNATVVFITDYAYGVSGDSFTNGPVNGNEFWVSTMTGSSTSLNNVKLNLASSTSFSNFAPLTPPTKTGSTGAYYYLWAFGIVPAGGNGVGGSWIK